MGSSSPGNSRRFYLTQSPSCENYERFNNGRGQDEMRIMQPEKGSEETFSELFKNSDGESEKQKGAFNIQPKKAPLETYRRLNLSDSIASTAKAKRSTVLSISSPGKPHWRFSVIFPERFNNMDREGEKQKNAFNFKPKKIPLEIFPDRFNKSDEEGKIQNGVFNKAPLETFPEQFKNINGEVEMQNDVLNIRPKKVPLEIFPERFNNTDLKAKKQKDAFNFKPQKTPPEIFPERFNKSDEEGKMQNDDFNIQPK